MIEKALLTAGMLEERSPGQATTSFAGGAAAPETLASSPTREFEDEAAASGAEGAAVEPGSNWDGLSSDMVRSQNGLVSALRTPRQLKEC